VLRNQARFRLALLLARVRGIEGRLLLLQGGACFRVLRVAPENTGSGQQGCGEQQQHRGFKRGERRAGHVRTCRLKLKRVSSGLVSPVVSRLAWRWGRCRRDWSRVDRYHTRGGSKPRDKNGRCATWRRVVAIKVGQSRVQCDLRRAVCRVLQRQRLDHHLGCAASACPSGRNSASISRGARFSCVARARVRPSWSGRAASAGKFRTTAAWRASARCASLPESAPPVAQTLCMEPVVAVRVRPIAATMLPPN